MLNKPGKLFIQPMKVCFSMIDQLQMSHTTLCQNVKIALQLQQAG